MKTLALLMAMLWPALLSAQSVKLPPEVKGEVGAFVRVPAETAESQVRWYSPDKGLAVFPVELLKDSKTAVVSASAKGRYRLVCWTAKGDVPSLAAECVVVIGDAPGPGPGPGPQPPTPTDPLAKAFLAAMGQESAADKVASASALAELYNSASSQVKTSTLTTIDQFNTGLKNARVALIGEKVPLLRAEIGKHLASVVPPLVGAPLDAPTRDKLSKAFADVAHALRACCP